MGSISGEVSANSKLFSVFLITIWELPERQQLRIHPIDLQFSWALKLLQRLLLRSLCSSHLNETTIVQYALKSMIRPLHGAGGFGSCGEFPLPALSWSWLWRFFWALWLYDKTLSKTILQSLPARSAANTPAAVSPLLALTWLFDLFSPPEEKTLVRLLEGQKGNTWVEQRK